MAEVFSAIIREICGAFLSSGKFVIDAFLAGADFF
jgi:hypothetical protein